MRSHSVNPDALNCFRLTRNTNQSIYAIASALLTVSMDVFELKELELRFKLFHPLYHQLFGPFCILTAPIFDLLEEFEQFAIASIIGILNVRFAYSGTL